MRKVRHIFFDLDHTLWDFERSARETLQEILTDFQNHLPHPILFEDFYQTYKKVIRVLWRMHRENEINKAGIRKQRFIQVFDHFDVPEQSWMVQFDDRYLAECPVKPHLMQGCIEVLDYLQDHFPLHIITNGFTESAMKKINASGIRKYFDQIITSETTGVLKPNPKIFQTALEMAKTSPQESLMIGDNYDTDIKGGLKIGMKTILYNPHEEKISHEVTQISSLSQLMPILNRG